MPTVSVVIPTFNRAKYILESINSVLNQTFTDYEIIVVDDGSTDDTFEKLEQLIENGTIRYYHQQNSGESAARNHGIREAKGKYVAFLDSDDLFLPSKLEKQVTFLNKYPDIGFVHSWYSKFNDGGDHLGIRDTSIFAGRFYPEILLIWSVLLAVPCVMVRREVLGEIGEFDEKQFWGPDLDLWRRITRFYPIGVIPEVLSKIRVHPGNISANKAEAVKWFERYLRKAFEDDPGLGSVFRRRAWSYMYRNVAHNLLQAGDISDMILVRKYHCKSLQFWPLQLSSYPGIVVSFLPQKIRAWLHKIWSKLRYKPQTG